MSDTYLANRDQAVIWNEGSGPVWVQMQPILDRVMAPLEDLVVEAGFPEVGNRILDLGCGAGATTLAMARRLGAAGMCVGLDLSAPLLSLARNRAAAAGLTNATFIEGDAQTHHFEAGTFDAAISRFGVMFFDDPVAAFANIRSALRPGGALTFVAWRGAAENGFMTAGIEAIASLLPEKGAAPVSGSAGPGSPGPFAFADASHVRGLLEASGWSAIRIDPSDVACTVDAPDLLTYVTRIGPAGAALRVADADTRAKATELLRRAYQRFVKDDAAHFNAACWLVTAHA